MPRRNKFNAIPTTTPDGTEFQSKKEAARYADLLLLLRAGEIYDLQVHPKFPIRVNGQAICTYIADFSYVDRQTGAVVVEDVKGQGKAKRGKDGKLRRFTTCTPAFNLKRKLMMAVYGIEVQIVYT